MSIRPVNFNPVSAFKPASDVSKLNPDDPHFLNQLSQVFENEKSKLSQLGPGVFTPSPERYQTLNFANLKITDTSVS